MAKLNKKNKNFTKTYNGAPAKRINNEQALQRSVLNCLLWENEFYEDGELISNRIAKLIPKVQPQFVYELAIFARNNLYLRHVPLFIAVCMLQHHNHKKFVGKLLPHIINRPDELTEILAIYWRNGRKPLANQLKKGLAEACHKFDEYQYAKWDRKKAIVRIKDVFKLIHPKPINEKEALLFQKIVKDELKTPNTWEVNLSVKGIDKYTVWTKMLEDKSLGGMALLRNLRNMNQAGVDQALIKKSILDIKAKNILPIRYIAAARVAPAFEEQLEIKLFESLQKLPKLKGHTVLLVDVSGSMNWALSSKSTLTRSDAANALAIMLRELCEQVSIYSFSLSLKRIPNRHGFALAEAIDRSQRHSSTYLGAAIKAIYGPKNKSFRSNGSMQGRALSPDRLIVLTDEQSDDPISKPKGRGYMINIASAKNGVGYGSWYHVDGWSDAVIRWITDVETYNF